MRAPQKSSPERGGEPLAVGEWWRGPTLAAGALAERWDPSVSPAGCHLPVPGRIS